MKKKSNLLFSANSDGLVSIETKNKKPFINAETHNRLKTLATEFGYYYDTKKSLLFINHKPHKILIIKNKVYFQHKREKFISLEREELLFNIMKKSKMRSSTGEVSFKSFFETI